MAEQISGKDSESVAHINQSPAQIALQRWQEITKIGSMGDRYQLLDSRQ